MATEGNTGRVVHDERGNAVWDWLKETGRMAIGSTSRLLKRLEAPELKMADEEERPGPYGRAGGYDPYERAAVATPQGKPEKKGYDPYQHSTPTRPAGRRR